MEPKLSIEIIAWARFRLTSPELVETLDGRECAGVAEVHALLEGFQRVDTLD